MKQPKSLVVIVCLLLVLAIGACCLLAAFGVVDVNKSLEYLEWWTAVNRDTGHINPWGKINMGAAGIALLALSLTGLFFYLRGTRRRGQISFPGAEGEVTVATTGLEEFIRRAAESIPGVREGEAMIKQHGKNRLAVIASVVLSSPKPVVEVTREIQNRIRHEVEQRLGLPKGTEIKVHVRRVIPDADESPEPGPFSAGDEPDEESRDE
jgi:uncharacterized alkaline shock family protein YloU